VGELSSQKINLMSNDPKKIDTNPIETVSAKRLRVKGKRVTIKDTFGRIEVELDLGFMLDGKVYRSPGISDRAAKIEGDFVVIRDGGKAYDRNCYNNY
jgi:hypothetical protein